MKNFSLINGKLMKLQNKFKILLGPHLFLGDVALDGDAVLDGLDGHQVHADAQRGHGHLLLGHLQPAARRRAKVHQRAGLLQKLEALVQLQQLERGTGAET